MEYTFGNIETKHLILRDWKEEDFLSLCEMNKNERVMEFFPKTLSEDESREFYDNAKAEISYFCYGLFAVEQKADNKFAGFIGLHNFNLGRLDATSEQIQGVEISWRLKPEFWGLGYATEGAEACLKFAKEEVELNEVYSFTSLYNKRSERVMQKIGMDFVKEFDHPWVPINSPLLRHVLYKKSFIKRKT